MKTNKFFWAATVAIISVVSFFAACSQSGNVQNEKNIVRDIKDFAPQFAAINDDIIFGEVWSREDELSLRDRSIITLTSIIVTGNFSELEFYLNFAKQNGVSKSEVVETITHLAFYIGWPNARTALDMAADIFTDDVAKTENVIFPKGDLITNDYFIGETFLHMLVNPEPPHDIGIGNVTFTPGARNNWHSHDVGQFLLVTGGIGYYQEVGQEARRLNVGDVVNIPAGVLHWHGAATDSWFSHIAITPGVTQWGEAVNDFAFAQANKVGRITQTAGRNALGDFAPQFAAYNDDVLFGQVWAKENILSRRDRSMITVTALMSGGNFGQLAFHLNFAKQNGLRKSEVSEIITHLSFYVGWPKAWSAFNIAMEIFTQDDNQTALSKCAIFPKGELITNDLFIGETYLHMLVVPQSPHDIGVGNVTFSPSARNNWHSHDVGQFLLVTHGVGYYQEEGKSARQLRVGDVVNIPAGVKHWHGAAPDSWFVHIAVTPGNTQWFEPLNDSEYMSAVGGN